MKPIVKKLATIFSIIWAFFGFFVVVIMLFVGVDALVLLFGMFMFFSPLFFIGVLSLMKNLISELKKRRKDVLESSYEEVGRLALEENVNLQSCSVSQVWKLVREIIYN